MTTTAKATSSTSKSTTTATVTASQQNNEQHAASALYQQLQHLDCDPATVALIAFLRSEADQSEQKAIMLRAQATALANQYNISQDLQQRYGE
jgi:ABC-type transporter Mla MlaB component